MGIRPEKSAVSPSSRIRAVLSGAAIGACLAALSFAVRQAGDQPSETQNFAALAPQHQERAPSSDIAQAGAPDPLPLDSGVTQPGASGAVLSGKAGLAARMAEKVPRTTSLVPMKARIAEARTSDRSLAASSQEPAPLRVGGRDARLRPDLVVIARSDLPAGVTPVSALGGRLVVRAQDITSGGAVQVGAVVQDSASSRLGILTGTLIVRVKDWSKRGELLADQGLVLRSEKSNIRFLFVSLPNPGAVLSDSVLAKLRQLEADSRVERVEAEVIYHQAVSK